MMSTYLTISHRTISAIHEQPWLLKIFALVLAALAPLAAYIHFLIFLLVIDAATSIYYQYKQKLKAVQKCKKTKLTLSVRIYTFFQTIESSKLRKTVEKLVSYTIAFIVAFLFDKYALQIQPLHGGLLNYFSLANVTVILVCSVEVTSIFANLSKITSNPIYTTILKILNRKIESKIDEL